MKKRLKVEKKKVKRCQYAWQVTQKKEKILKIFFKQISVQTSINL
jgi:hypothetical protein